jgi:hypothetical protein
MNRFAALIYQKPRIDLVILLVMVIFLISGCQPAAEFPSESQPAPGETSGGEPSARESPESQPTETSSELEEPSGAVATQASPSSPSPLPAVESWLGEAEWPAEMKMGDSDTVRLKILPAGNGYTVAVDFPEHRVELEPLAVQRPEGYDLTAAARLDGIGFQISPNGEQTLAPLPGEAVEWVWTVTPQKSGQQRLSLSAVFHWTPRDPAANLPARQSVVYARGLDVQVTPRLGAVPLISGAVFGLLALAASFILAGAWFVRRQAQPRILEPRPNAGLVVETKTGINLESTESDLLRTLFRDFQRVLVEEEFLSGYSGARTLLVLPLQADGRRSARTIVKIGSRRSILQEYDNYQSFVKQTLPPVTARIQQPPVGRRGYTQAALQYTFIATPDSPPASLREALLADPDPAILFRLFDTFAPGWWLQRHPYTFSMRVEYDRMLPSHLVIRPIQGRGLRLEGSTPPDRVDLALGENVRLVNFPYAELRPDRSMFSLSGQPAPGEPPLRVRWLSNRWEDGASGEITGSRETTLAGLTRGFSHYDHPEPLNFLGSVLQRPVHGSRSVIHGDLNLENVLIGPGGAAWLIDFAQTREGHTLFDFAHLYAEIIAHILSVQVPSLDDFHEGFQSDRFPLLNAIVELGSRCLFDPAQPLELHLALFVACLGALKYENISHIARQRLYLAAAVWAERLKLSG